MNTPLFLLIMMINYIDIVSANTKWKVLHVRVPPDQIKQVTSMAGVEDIGYDYKQQILQVCMHEKENLLPLHHRSHVICQFRWSHQTSLNLKRRSRQ